MTQVPLWITARSVTCGLLLGLHVFWWALLNRIGFKILMGQAANKVGDEEYEITTPDGAHPGGNSAAGAADEKKH